MGQQSLIYSFVARGTVILAEYTEFKGNFTGIAAQCLQKLPASNNKFTYNCDGHTFNYLVEDGFSTVLSIYVSRFIFSFFNLIWLVAILLLIPISILCVFFFFIMVLRLHLCSLFWLTFIDWSVCLTDSFECIFLSVFISSKFVIAGDLRGLIRYQNLWIRIMWWYYFLKINGMVYG
jgi:hypothetical protein